MIDVTLDLRGVRPVSTITTEWVVSSRPSRHPVRQWAATMHPLEQNLLSGVAGASLTLCRTEDLETGPAADRWAGRRVREHAARGRRPTLKDVVAGRLTRRRLRSCRPRERAGLVV